ncbi:MAG: Trk system potassium transporter TrkA [Lentisphaeria bacterium]|nr:Trk system potassium transporter TrkA [Lentisphaeria bacterium]
MRIVIVGAGELGCLLAARLSTRNEHDITVIDSSGEQFERLREKLDLMLIEGSATDIALLKRAGVESADIVFAVSGDEHANMVVCQIARSFGVKNTICRVYSLAQFSEEDNILPATFGIEKVFSSPDECANKVLDVLQNQNVLEKIRFSNPAALMEVIEVTPSSMIAGVRIKDFPGIEVLRNVRLAALVRDQRFIIPHGDTIIVPGDRLYVAGTNDTIGAFMRMISETSSAIGRVVISGASKSGELLAKQLLADGYEIRIIEKDPARGEHLLDVLPPGLIVIQGDPTDEEVMEEAGISHCDAFVSMDENDESGILSCIMAKRLGAKKVVVVTHKSEYISIVPALEVIDCGFNSTLVSVNALFRLMGNGTYQIDAKLERFHANLKEFKVSERSRLCGTSLAECKLPPSTVFAMLFRGTEVIIPSGTTIFQPGDIAVAVTTPETAKALEPYFLR